MGTDTSDSEISNQITEPPSRVGKTITSSLVALITGLTSLLSPLEADARPPRLFHDPSTKTESPASHQYLSLSQLVHPFPHDRPPVEITIKRLGDHLIGLYAPRTTLGPLVSNHEGAAGMLASIGIGGFTCKVDYLLSRVDPKRHPDAIAAFQRSDIGHLRISDGTIQATPANQNSILIAYSDQLTFRHEWFHHLWRTNEPYRTHFANEYARRASGLDEDSKTAMMLDLLGMSAKRSDGTPSTAFRSWKRRLTTQGEPTFASEYTAYLSEVLYSRERSGLNGPRTLIPKRQTPP